MCWSIRTNLSNRHAARLGSPKTHAEGSPASKGHDSNGIELNQMARYGIAYMECQQRHEQADIAHHFDHLIGPSEKEGW
jgi:hypothetical protein